MMLVKIKKQKARKNVTKKESLNLKIEKHCLEATQFENKIKTSKENEIGVTDIN